VRQSSGAFERLLAHESSRGLEHSQDAVPLLVRCAV